MNSAQSYFVSRVIKNVTHNNRHLACLLFLNTEHEDWRADGCRWRQNGQSLMPKKSPIVKKLHFDLQTPDGAVKTFQKFVFLMLSEPQYAVVQYTGDSRVSVDFPHG